MRKYRNSLLSSLYLFQLLFGQACTQLFLLPPSVASPSTGLQLGSTSARISEREIAEALANSYLNKTPFLDIPDDLDLDRARKIQAEFLQLLIPRLGKTVGYKAGLTSIAAQETFKTSQPVLGILLEKMLLRSGAAVPVNFGAVPMLEGDLLVRVGSEGINTAKTSREALEALDSIIPFIELPDLVYAREIQLNVPKIVAINVGARLGIVGEPIPLQPTEQWQDRIKKIKLTLSDGLGRELAVGDSSALLGDPLNVVLWLRDSLKERGKLLKKGDLLSLGTITPPIPVRGGQKIEALYIGLDPDRPVEISVYFPARDGDGDEF